MASLQHEPRVTGGSNRVSAVDLSVLNSKDFDDHKDIDHDQVILTNINVHVVFSSWNKNELHHEILKVLAAF